MFKAKTVAVIAVIAVLSYFAMGTKASMAQKIESRPAKIDLIVDAATK